MSDHTNMVIQAFKVFFLFVCFVFCTVLHISSISSWYFLLSGLYHFFYFASAWMKCSLIFQIFLEEISSLSPSVVFLSFFAWFIEEGLLVSLLFFGTLHLVGCTFPFAVAFHFTSQLFVKPPQTTTLPSFISFPLGWFCLLPPVQYYELLSIVLQALSLQDLILWIYSSPPLCFYRGFDLSCTWLTYGFPPFSWKKYIHLYLHLYLHYIYVRFSVRKWLMRLWKLSESKVWRRLAGWRLRKELEVWVQKPSVIEQGIADVVCGSWRQSVGEFSFAWRKSAFLVYLEPALIG